MLDDLGIEMNGLWGSRAAISSISFGIILRPQSGGGSSVEVVIVVDSMLFRYSLYFHKMLCTISLSRDKSRYLQPKVLS